MRYSSSIILFAAVCGCSIETDVTEPSLASAVLTSTPSYQIATLPSLGGTLSRGTAINDQSWVAGWSNRSDGTRHAALWRNGAITDLLTLGGPSSTVAWPGLNDDGMVVGVSQTAEIDPLNEDWSCEAGGFLPESASLICRGFVFSQGVMQELPTLGGHHGFAAGVNNRGEVVGWAETPVHDPTCTSGVQVLQFRAVVWEPKKNKVKTRELVPFAGDSTSAATAINDRGEAVGISGDCDQAVGRFSARHAVLWSKNGKVTEIPNLGGVSWHTPMDINESGDVVGFSNPAGPGDPEGEFISHAFLWRRGAAKSVDLGTLPGDLFSEAFAINKRGQVVGVSFGGSSGSRAFLWDNGVMTNLNDLAPGNLDVLLSGQDINDDGQITGRLRDYVTGETLAFVATPSGCP
jgi:probable HAF family extracellular repeat protein